MRAVLPAILSLALGLASAPAYAAGGGGDHAAPAKESAKGTPGNNVEMPTLMAPVGDDGKLVAYAYISAKIEASSAGSALAIREKLAFLQDAFVREVNRASVAEPDRPEHIDEHKLQVRMLAVARTIMGDKKIKNLTITKVQVASLYPKAKAEPLPPEAVFSASAQKKPAKPASSGHH